MMKPYSFRDSNDYDYLFKILLIGDSGVGKSSILHRFVDDLYTTTHISTIGVDFKIKTLELDGKIIKLQIWDTAGQERFRTITQSYYRGAHGIFVVFDLTHLESFRNIKYWIQEIEKYNNNSADIILIGNKSDIPEHRKVSNCEINNFCSNFNNISYLETSALNNFNIEKMFIDISIKIRSRTNNIRQNKENIKHQKLYGKTIGTSKCCL